VLTLVDEKQPLMALAFIPSVGDQAREGMDAQVSPSSFPRQEFGFMKGKVVFASRVPVRTHMLYELTRNQALNEELMKGGAPFLIKVLLDPDPDSASGFKWSSSHGPSKRVRAGMVGEARVVVESQRPISMAVPALRSFLGL
jgi:HlyD family secretion protein